MEGAYSCNEASSMSAHRCSSCRGASCLLQDGAQHWPGHETPPLLTALQTAKRNVAQLHTFSAATAAAGAKKRTLLAGQQSAPSFKTPPASMKAWVPARAPSASTSITSTSPQLNERAPPAFTAHDDTATGAAQHCNMSRSGPIP